MNRHLQISIARLPERRNGNSLRHLVHVSGQVLVLAALKRGKPLIVKERGNVGLDRLFQCEERQYKNEK